MKCGILRNTVNFNSKSMSPDLLFLSLAWAVSFTGYGPFRVYVEEKERLIYI